MLPKNKLRDRRLERLRIFADEDMAAFRSNILKRWEDGTLPGENVRLSKPQ
jgi:large subunit ribosomal protein L13